jgi:alkanesulfonate monooxygenase SsuD/methylene tetrahydromethanopterin reductase-like flavin-dependent oxidoreductase (luciferase family)
MEFNHFLSSFFPDPSYGGQRLFADMIEQAKLADRLGYASVSVPEHHLINILLTPAPLQMAVRVAAETEHVKIATSVAVLPIHDMRTYAGEVIMADILTDGRLVLGVGRGAFPYEMGRLGVQIEQSREKFDESLNVLQALLSREEVSWEGTYYNFEPMTVMPRPERPIQMMMAVMVPEAIYHCTKRGFHIQTTPLQGTREHMLEQVGAFVRGRDELGAAGAHLTLSLLRIGFVVSNEAEKRRLAECAYTYYERFDNVYVGGPGTVEHGAIKPLKPNLTVDELMENLLIGTPQELIDKLSVYAEAGVDETIINMNIGAGQTAVLEGMQRFAEEVMPHFSKQSRSDSSTALQNA